MVQLSFGVLNSIFHPLVTLSLLFHKQELYCINMQRVLLAKFGKANDESFVITCLPTPNGIQIWNEQAAITSTKTTAAFADFQAA